MRNFPSIETHTHIDSLDPIPTIIGSFCHTHHSIILGKTWTSCDV